MPLPPLRKAKLPPPRLPSGEFVRVIRLGSGYGVGTNGICGSNPVGPRLNRGQGIIPDYGVFSTIADAATAMKKWDDFCKVNQREFRKKQHEQL